MAEPREKAKRRIVVFCEDTGLWNRGTVKGLLTAAVSEEPKGHSKECAACRKAVRNAGGGGSRERCPTGREERWQQESMVSWGGWVIEL